MRYALASMRFVVPSRKAGIRLENCRKIVGFGEEGRDGVGFQGDVVG